MSSLYYGLLLVHEPIIPTYPSVGALNVVYVSSSVMWFFSVVRLLVSVSVSCYGFMVGVRGWYVGVRGRCLSCTLCDTC